MDETTRRDADRDLVERILRGDLEAFGRLVEKYHPRVFRLVHGILGDWQYAEDVCQDVFVSVYTKLDGFGFRSKFSTWIYRVGVNAALKVRTKSAKFQREVQLDDTALGSPLDDTSAERLEESELVGKLLRPLPPHLRAVVVLKEREGLSYKEIAGVLGCSPGAVEQRLHRAFVRLREIWKGRMSELGLEDPEGRSSR